MINMKIPFSVLLCLTAQLSFAQDFKIRTCYYSSTHKLLDNREGAYYYTYDTIGDQYGSYSYYTSNNQLKSVTAPGSSKEPRHETSYYENGAKQAEGVFKYGNPVGRLSLWYSNGQQLAEAVFPDEAKAKFSTDYQIINYWDSLGTQIIKSGSGSGELKFSKYIDGGNGTIVDGRKDGVWKGNLLVTGPYEEKYDHGKLVEGVSTVDGKTYKYTVLGEPAVLKNGLEAFYKQISKNLRYPNNARRMRKEGVVYLGFEIEKDGSMSNLDILKGFDPECDAEALRTIKALSPPWNPGLERGVPVRTRYVLPIRFKF